MPVSGCRGGAGALVWIFSQSDECFTRFTPLIGTKPCYSCVLFYCLFIPCKHATTTTTTTSTRGCGGMIGRREKGEEVRLTGLSGGVNSFMTGGGRALTDEHLTLPCPDFSQPDILLLIQLNFLQIQYFFNCSCVICTLGFFDTLTFQPSIPFFVSPLTFFYPLPSPPALHLSSSSVEYYLASGSFCLLLFL